VQILSNLPIPKPPWTKLGRKIESACRKALHTFEMIDGSKIAVALSGGKDSLTLLYMLHAIRDRGFPNFDLVAIHVGGAYSCGAALQGGFLPAICNALDIPLIVKETEQTLEKLECYSCSRERRRILFNTAKEEGATVVAFGHHRDDSVETLLMNLLHKAEFAANLPKLHMVDYGITIIRPLIYVSEEEIRTFAQNNGFARITCRCPVGQQSRRRQVKELLNQIEEIYPDARSNLAQAGLHFGSRKAERP
jgi:tRNA 2-thiocytidine biosynthesis protein TtcA